MADWVQRFTGGANASSTGSLTLTLAAGYAQNDIILLCLAHNGGAFGSTPAGFSIIVQDLNATNSQRVEIYYKIAGASEPGSYTVSGLGTAAAGYAMAYGGVDTTSPVQASVVQHNASGTRTWPSYTTTAADTLLIPFAAINVNSSFNALFPGTPANVSIFWPTQGFSPVAERDSTLGLSVAGWHLLKILPETVTGLFWGASQTASANTAVIVALNKSTAAISGANYYLTSVVPPFLYLGQPQGAFTSGDGRSNRGFCQWTYMLTREKTHAGSSPQLVTDQFNETNCTQILGRWMTVPLAAQTISGTLNAMLCMWGINSPKMFLNIYATVGDTAAVRGTLLANYVDATVLPNFSEYRNLASGQTLTSTTIQDGDRVVVEIGLRFTSQAAASSAGHMFCGSNPDGSLVPFPDGTNGLIESRYATYVTFPSVLTELGTTSPIPSNGSAATATALTFPFSDAQDVSNAQTGDKAVWYTYTPATNQSLVLNTLGSSYGTLIEVYSGTPGSLTYVDSAAHGMWLNRSANNLVEPLTGDTTYYIKIGSFPGLGVGNVSAQSAGYLRFAANLYDTTEAIDDLTVNGQYLARYRNGSITQLDRDLFNSTPTGSVIDITGIAITDQSTGLPTTVKRYLCGLFGSSPLVEILDYDTLNFGTPEIEYIFDPLQTGSQNIGSLAMDQAGYIYIGYYGDNYDVVGKLSSPTACQIQKISVTHGDLEPIAPFPNAQTFTIQQENSGSDFLDIAADQKTLFYTSAGRNVFKYDTSGTGTQLANFATGLSGASTVRPGLRMVRILPPGDGSGGVLVADGDTVKRLDATGAIVQTYTPSSADGVVMHDLDKIDLNADGSKFWVSDQFQARLFQFNTSTGAQLSMIDTGLPIGQVCGFSSFGGYRAGLSPRTLAAFPPTPPVIPGTCCDATPSSTSITSPAPSSGTNVGGVGFCTSYTGASGVVPIGADPQDGDPLTGKRTVFTWMEMVHWNY